MVSLCGQNKMFVSPLTNPERKICNIVVSEHPEMIEGRLRLVATDVLDSKEAAENFSICDDGAALDDEDESGSGEASLRTGFTQLGTEDVEEVYWVMKYSFLLSFMFKPPFLITQRINNNNKSQENLSKNMFNFGARTEWRNGRRSVISYLDVDIRNDQYRLVNTTPLDCIIGYIM